jgi:broad specificity phosphatase PhoE
MTNERRQKWPQRLWIVRHGKSAGNVARDRAELAGLPVIDIETRDVDVPLSELGARQALALGKWFRDLPSPQRPTVILTSPYARARATAQCIVDQMAQQGADLAMVVDERLREKEFGILDGLTRIGIANKYPDIGAQRTRIGKFYFRPPGGESWCDVILRLRSMLDTLVREYAGENVLIVGHQVIVNCFHYLLDRLDEQQILDLDRAGDIPNCSVTSWEFDAALGRHGKLALRLVNFVTPLEEQGTPVTAEPAVNIAPEQ